MNLKLLTSATIILLCTGLLTGQDKVFTASAPAVVKSGEQFQYVIEGSLDGTKWTQLVDQRNNTAAATARGRIFWFPTQSLRYVRATITHNSVGKRDGGRIVEIEGYAVDQETINARQQWSKVAGGLHGSVASIDQRYEREKVPDLTCSMRWSDVVRSGKKALAKLSRKAAEFLPQ